MNVPVLDRCSNGLISLVSNEADETAEPFDTNRFVHLMMELLTAGVGRTRRVEQVEEDQDTDMERQEMNNVLLEGAGTPADPLLIDFVGL
jgi:hypothetical protein